MIVVAGCLGWLDATEKPPIMPQSKLSARKIITIIGPRRSDVDVDQPAAPYFRGAGVVGL
jgi:hypothetical protein